MKAFEMVNHLKLTCDSWFDVYNLYGNKVSACLSIHGWFVSFDGPSLNEMYLTNTHPLSDESGDVITVHSFNNW